ncbi:uncharacterized protein LOC141656981 [Silene latifolia]|uniref:uncharacterized protein LOC141656981 n=1 Tax=Silene latifolia TaxID=37657 RepID=UPI003D78A264
MNLLLSPSSGIPLRNTGPCLKPCVALSDLNPVFTNSQKRVIKYRESKLKVRALGDVSSSVDPVQAQVTWEIVVGSLAGVIPFIVAGIEFNKRIVAQRRCEVCRGSGLVLRDKKYYFRCPGCGGFLPWQSWKRFFSG